MTRQMGVSVPAGTDLFQLRAWRGREELGRPFTFELDLLSRSDAIAFDEVLGFPATVRLSLESSRGTERHFHGIVSRFEQRANHGRYASYRATVSPWLWFLGHRSNCRIFQNRSALEIIETIFQEHGGDFELRLSRTYAPRKYCVQYRETDFAFVSRLMEEEGLYYSFRHEPDRHILVLCDRPGLHTPFPGYDTVVYDDTGARPARLDERIHGWRVTQVVRPCRYETTDYDFLNPGKAMRVSMETQRGHGHNHHEIFDYPGKYYDAGRGNHLGETRMIELQARQELVTGHGDVRGLAPGHLFRLAEHPRADRNRSYLVVSASHVARSDEWESGPDAADGPLYRCRFTCIPDKQVFVPERRTPRPIVEGPQTAVVVGREGDEIHTDEFGRIRVQFHWDRYGERDQKSSCFIRVAQPNAGANWGGLYTPRVNQEVIVEFLEGDPDRPIVTGAVYNGDNHPPYVPKSQPTVFTFKSNSSKGGGGFNELKFDDKKGSELVYVQAEKDRTVLVKHDNAETIGNHETLSVGVDRTKSVGSNEQSTIGANRTEQVGADETITIGANRTETVGANETITVGANRTEQVGGNESITVGSVKTENVGAAKMLTIGAAYQVTVGAVMNVSTGGAMLEEVGAYKLQAVGGDMKTVVGGDMDHGVSGKHVMKADEITIDAGTKITIQCGASKIVLTPGDITISAPLVKINC
ncbi:MAG: type VI secretion system tip protein VgrG [Phycisphaerales bacterium]|nr:type VI secretion system tip protein VgrG [Phycisphaerales bacterium]